MSLLLVLLISLNIFNPFSVSVLDSRENQKTEPHRINRESLGILISAKSALAVDKESNKILFSKNKEKILPIASITKLISILVFLDQKIDLNKEVVIKKEDRREGGRIYLGYGERVSIDDLLNLSLVASDNEAVAALMRVSGFSEKEFVDLMNAKAMELKMDSSHFVDPTGLNPGNVSTPGDLIKLAEEAFSRPEIVKRLNKKEYSFSEKKTGKYHRVFSTDKLLGGFLKDSSQDYFLQAGKTGYLDEAGYCFLAQVKNKKGKEIIIVLLGSNKNVSRFQETKGIIAWIFNNWTWENMEE